MVGKPHHQLTDFKNPVYPASFPDPFVLEYDGAYYAYSTGIGDDGRVFPAAVSSDLVAWKPVGGVMPRLERDSPHYWAPEVVYDNGKFYLYYSVGNEEWMELRVAVSDRPDGAFEDAGLKLTKEQFAIDAHVLKDDDGSWYMFYATDFLDYEFVGTGVVVDRMLDPFTLEGAARPAARARYDWQVYDPNRKEKGGVRWYTVEGPSVVKRKGRYFMTYSGGNWQNESYGVGFAVSDNLGDPNEWRQSCDGTSCLPILRSVPERILGPGHNSIARAPNGRELVCVYHEWQNGDRKMAIDRMEIVADRVLILGPTDEAQPVPHRPQHLDRLDDWEAGCGCWSDEEKGIVAGPDSTAEIVFRPESSSHLFRTGVRMGQGDGSAGVKIKTPSGEEFPVLIEVAAGQAGIRCGDAASGGCETQLSDFHRGSLYQLRIETDERSVTAYIDERRVGSCELREPVSSISLVADGPEAIFSANRITYGFEELFTDESLAARGWRTGAEAKIEGHNLILDSSAVGSLSRNLSSNDNFELAVNCRARGSDAKLSVSCGVQLSLEGGAAWRILSAGQSLDSLAGHGFETFRQIRLISRGGDIEVFVDDHRVAAIAGKGGDAVEIISASGTWELDMVRYTHI